MQSSITSIWRRPPVGFVKLSDAAVRHNVYIDVGFVIRDDVLGAGVDKIRENLKVECAEVIDILKGVIYVMAMCFNFVIVETDRERIIALLLSNIQSRSEVESIVGDCKQVGSTFWSVRFSHIRRGSNT